MSGSIKNIKDLIEALKGLEKGKVLEKNSELYLECREAFKKLQILDDFFNPNDVLELISVLDNLPEEIKLEEIGKIDYDAKKLDSKALNKQDLESLIKDYEEAKDEGAKEVIRNEITDRTGKIGRENVDQFIKGQKEIAERNKKNLEIIEKIDPKLKGEIETKLEKVEEGMEEVKAKRIEEMVLEEKEYKKKELEKEVQKIVNDKGKAREISQEIRRERAEIKVVKSADEIATKMCEELKKDQVDVSERTRVELRENILESWENGEKLIIPQKISEVTQGKVILEKISLTSENFKNENLETMVTYRAEQLKKEIAYELRSNGVKDEKFINEFAEVTVELKYSTEEAFFEVNSQKIADQIYSTQEGKRFEVQPENAVKEAKEIAGYLTKSPKKFNALVDKYHFYREKIGSDKLPNIEKLRVTDKLMGIFKEGSEARKWINGAQRMVSFMEKFETFPGNLFTKFGIQNVGMKVLGKIGGQAAVEFVKQASLVIAKQGTLQGIKSIALGIMGKGAVTAASSGAVAAGGGIVAGVAAVPGIGWIVAGAMLVLGVLKKIGGKIGGWIKDKLNIDLGGTGNFFSNLVGMKGGGKYVVGAITKIGSFLATLPTMVGTIGPIVAIVLVVVIVFMLASTMSNQGLISSIVPPADMGNCVPKDEYGGAISCDPNAPENSITGVDKANFIDVANRWQSGSNFASVCYNDTVNRALCAGINPTYALWVWLHESGASNYATNNIEDFGIHDSITPDNNFNAQITKFLTLTEVGKRCLSDPRINGDFWLSWATSYLNGYDCNPDKPNPTFPDMTPRKYAAELRDQWTWISSSPLPDGILVAKAGKNCGQSGVGSTAYAGNSHEVTDKDGKVWICTENTQSPVGNYDPNSPGLTGVVVEGECSVGDVVVPTKQCDSQWGQTLLNGGACSNGKPGTICSAGCGPSSVSMLMRHVNGSLTPKNIIFNPGSAYINMGCEGSSFVQAQTELIKKFGSGAITYNAVTIGCDEKAIAKWICDGKVVMVLSNFYRNSKLEIGGHYVVAIGVKGGKIVVQDPYYDVTETPFDGTRAYGYAADHPRECLLIDKNSIK